MFDDEGDEPDAFAPPPSPDDRLWRHPSEIAASRTNAAISTQPIEQHSVGRMFGVAGLSALGGGLIVAGLWITLGSLNPTTGERAAVELVEMPSIGIAPDDDDTTLVAAAEWPSAVAELAKDAVVDLDDGAAVGVIVRSDGYAVTAASSVSSIGAIDVDMADGSPVVAEVIGIDTLADIAIIELNEVELAPAVMSADEPLDAGTITVALAGTDPETDAIVSSVIDTQVRFDAPDGPFHGLIEIEPSDVTGLRLGSPVLDDSGTLVGVITRIDPETGRVYVTPIAVARRVATDLIEHGSITHAWLGVQGTDTDPELAAEHDVSGAAVVNEVVLDSPAADCGLVEGDLIIGLDETTVDSMSGLVGTVLARYPGDSITIEYLRATSVGKCTTELAERPS